MKRKFIIITVLIFLITLTIFLFYEYKTTIKDTYKIYDSQLNPKGIAEFNVEITSIISKQYLKGEIKINSKPYSLYMNKSKLNSEGLYELTLTYYDSHQGGARYIGYMFYDRNYDIFAILQDSYNFDVITNKNIDEIKDFLNKIVVISKKDI